MRIRLLVPLAVVLMFVQVVLTMLVAPAAANFNAPFTQRIFYYHVPTAWVAYLAFAVTAVASALYLRKPSERADAIALASAEVGSVFSIMALITGLLWSREEFVGYAAIEDPKVISLVVVIFAYFAYLTLRSNVEEREKRGRLAAVFGLLAFIGVPLSYFASRASIHPDFTRPEQSLDPRLGWILLASTLIFTALYGALVSLRADMAQLDARLTRLEDK